MNEKRRRRLESALRPHLALFEKRPRLALDFDKDSSAVQSCESSGMEPVTSSSLALPSSQESGDSAANSQLDVLANQLLSLPTDLTICPYSVPENLPIVVRTVERTQSVCRNLNNPAFDSLRWAVDENRSDLAIHARAIVELREYLSQNSVPVNEFGKMIQVIRILGASHQEFVERTASKLNSLAPMMEAVPRIDDLRRTLEHLGQRHEELERLYKSVLAGQSTLALLMGDPQLSAQTQADVLELKHQIAGLSTQVTQLKQLAESLHVSLVGANKLVASSTERVCELQGKTTALANAVQLAGVRQTESEEVMAERMNRLEDQVHFLIARQAQQNSSSRPQVMDPMGEEIRGASIRPGMRACCGHVAAGFERLNNFRKRHRRITLSGTLSLCVIAGKFESSSFFF